MEGWAVDWSLENAAFGLGLGMQRQGGRQWGDRSGNTGVHIMKLLVTKAFGSFVRSHHVGRGDPKLGCKGCEQPVGVGVIASHSGGL